MKNNFVLKVLVQLPDGSTQKLPVVEFDEFQNLKVKVFPSREEAYDWKEFILPCRVIISNE